jgi:hypothetical protein
MLFIDNNLNNSNKKHKKLDSNLLIESIDERLSDSNFKRKVKPLKTNYGNIKKLNLSDLSISDFKNNKKNSKISKDFESLSAISDIKKKHVKFKSSKKKDSLKRDLTKENEMLYFENEKGEENDKKESEESIHSDIEEIEEKEIEYEDDNIEMGRVTLRARKKNKKIILPKTQIKKDPKWVETKKLFFQKLKEQIENSDIEDNIDVSITSIISLNKTDYSKYSLNQKFRIQLIKKSNEINWIKNPYSTFKKKISKIPSLNHLLKKIVFFDFDNNSLNEFEPYLGETKFLRLNYINGKENKTYITLSKETINQNVLILIFSFENPDSIILFKEMLEYIKNKKKKNNKFSLQFFPVYGPILEKSSNINYVWEMTQKNEFEKDLEIYFIENNNLTQKFQYITDDKKIICKYILIDSSSIIRKIGNPKKFTFNLINQMDKIDKNDYEIIKENLTQFVSEQNYSVRDLQKHPISCSLFLNKTTIYSYDKSDQIFVTLTKYYDTLTGEIKNEDNILELYQDLDEVGKFEKRENPKKFQLSFKKKTEMISNLIGDVFQRSLLEKIKYITKFEKNSILMKINPNKKPEQKFNKIKKKSIIFEAYIKYEDFLQRHHYPIIKGSLDLLQFSFSNNINYFSCVLANEEQFPNTIKLYNSETKEPENLTINENGSYPSLLIIFSLNSKDYLAKMEMIYRLNKIYKKIFNLRNTINIHLIYRGELYPFEREISELRNEEIFRQNYSLHILPSNISIFPLYYNTNIIETCESQLKIFLLDKKNNVAYAGICDDINLRGSIINLHENSYVKYMKHYPLNLEDFTNEIKPRIKEIEQIIERAFIKKLYEDEILLYRPYVSFSYCKCVNYIDDKCDNDVYINNLRLRILVKEKHKNFILKNVELKEHFKIIKEYGTTILIIPIPCENLQIEYKCKLCNKGINKKKGFFYNQNEKSTICLNCEKNLNQNNIFLIYIKSTNIDKEIISELYNFNIKYELEIGSSLGQNCKICNELLINDFYLNLTHFNQLSDVSPLLPIDICSDCFNIIEKGEDFKKKKLKEKFNKFGLSYEQMIYKKINSRNLNNDLIDKNQAIDLEL